MPSSTTNIRGFDVLERPIASFLPPPPCGMRIRHVSIEIEYDDQGNAIGGRATASYFEITE
jgi:hypothetical protein